MPSPNPEQKRAIEHYGGVLLKAGAGSGKTFVLKEHIVYRVEKWIEEFRQGEFLDFEIFLKGKLRKIVLMTFTKKAAGELEIRLFHAFQEKANDVDESTKKFWDIAYKCLGQLHISTIHGFCYRLIQMGLFSDVASDETILSEVEFQYQIEELFTKWLGEQVKNDFVDLLIKERKSVLSALISIFGDPTIRISWEEASLQSIVQDSEQTIQDLFKLLGFETIFKKNFSLASYGEFSDKKWYPFLDSFLNLITGMQINLENIVKIDQFLANIDYKIPVKPRGKTIPPELISYYEEVKALKDYLKKNGEHFVEFFQGGEGRLDEWGTYLEKLFAYMNENYKKSSGITFADLEYIVFKGLQSPSVVKSISEQFSYFIIDEFQDTSYIQFSIIEKIVQGDYAKIFCVGDLKQAIYGFRGGELGVFLDCAEKIDLNLSLTNNYRSTQSVINVNNKLFDNLFHKGIGFKGKDIQSVEVEYQTVPEGQDDIGEVYEIIASVPFDNPDEKISNLEVDFIEASALFEQIKKLREEEGDIAILYKRLKPSLILIDFLIKNKIGFTAQVKIPNSEDPIIGIFYLLVEYYLNKNETREYYVSFCLESYLKLLGSELLYRPELLHRFDKDCKTIGLYHGFLSFCSSLGLANSNFEKNFEQVRLLIKQAAGDIEVVYSSLNSSRGNSYSLDFQYGENPNDVQIMTAHASKGLQFAHVLVGGMYTNDSSIINTSLVGKIPFSFKWSKSIHGKKKFKTPQYMLEEFLTKHKEFSESKRLFYVTNTRAEKTLGFVHIEWGDFKRSKSQSSSWSEGLNSGKESSVGLGEHLGSKDITVETIRDKSLLGNLDKRPPLFHIDNLGLNHFKAHHQDVYLPEISVTKFANLVICPRKFYLQNICKISADELKFLDQNIKNDELELSGNDNEELTSDSFRMSASERGSLIHEVIAEQIDSGFENNFQHSDTGAFKAVSWTVEKLKNYVGKFNFISEQAIKFELFGYMISGIPDLIIQETETMQSVEIWDFKTGKSEGKDLSSYWFQLYGYAYSQLCSAGACKEKSIKLVLCFVDEKELVEQTVSKLDVENYFEQQFKHFSNLLERNTEACKYCPYLLICEE